MDLLDIETPQISDPGGRGSTIEREPDEQQGERRRRSTRGRIRQHPYRRNRTARRDKQWFASASLAAAAAGTAVACWFLLWLLASRAPGLVPDLNTAIPIALLLTAGIAYLLPRDRYAYGTRAIGLGILAVTLSFIIRDVGRAPLLSTTLSVDAALVASCLFRLAGGPPAAVGAPDRHPLTRALIPVGLSAIATLALLQRSPGVVAADEIAAGISLATACLAVVAVARRYARGRAPGWLLWSLVAWAACQLQLVVALATHRSWPDPGLDLAFACAITVGAFVELRRLTRALQSPARSTYGRTRPPAAARSREAEYIKLLAHELGSPLAALRTWSHFMATDPALPSRHEKSVRGIQHEIAALDGLVADMRGATAVRGVMFGVQPQPTPIRQIMDEAMHFAESLPGRHVVITDITADQQVLADPARIGQVLRNLLSNADKYSEPGSPITLRAELRQESVQIEVIDQGVGICEEDREWIFKKFGRGQAVDGQSVPGMGVGLYVAQNIVQAHNSEIRVVSVPDLGSRFAFDLRIAS